MLRWGPDITAGSAGGIGFFYAIVLAQDAENLWRLYGAGQRRAV
jgi:hypothetical protein